MTGRALRIVMTADTVGGVWVYATGLARALCAAGHRVMLVVMGPPPRSDQLAGVRDVPGLALQATDLQLEWMDPQGADVARAHRALLRLADDFKPDLVHLNSFREGSFEWPAPTVVVAHSCVRTWWRACRGGTPQEPQWRGYAENVARGLAAADAWVAPTAAFRQEIARHYSPPLEGRVVRNGLDVAAAPALKQPIILAAGRLWDEAKNVAALVTGAHAVPWPIRLAGECRAPGGAAAPIAGDGIDYLGALPHDALLAQMRRAAIFAAPALYEPFGLTVLEAASCGCALVLSDLPSFRELWDGAAAFVDPRDPAMIAATLRTLCRDRTLRERLQRAARARARSYSGAAMRDAYQRLYRELIARPSAAAVPDRGASLGLPA